MPTPETNYLLIHEQQQKIIALETRLEVMEFFIKKQFPEFYAGEADTVVDPEFNDVVIDTAAPLAEELPQPNTGLVPLEDTPNVQQGE